MTTRALVPLAQGRAGGAGLAPADALRYATRLGLGAAGLALAALAALLERSQPGGPGTGPMARTREPPGLLRLVPGAAVGLGMEAQRRSMRTAAVLGGRVAPGLSAVARPLAAVLAGPAAAAYRRLDLDGWGEQGLAEQRRNEQLAAAFVRALLGAVVAAVLDEVDLNAVIARVDLDRILERVDIEAVLARVDLDAVIARVDLDAVVGRVDLPGIITRVMDEVDVGQLVRESSSTMATESVDALRVQGMRADRLLNRVVDRAMRRTGERQSGPAAPGAVPPADRAGR
jgi:hypothetical protein